MMPMLSMKELIFCQKNFFQKLVLFIEKNVTDRIITEDLSSLIDPPKFKVLRKVLKREIIQLLKDRIEIIKERDSIA